MKHVIDHKGFLSYTDLSQECKTGLAEESRVAITNRIFPALREVSRFIKENYLPNCRKEYGVGSLPNGEEYYRETLRQVSELTVAMHENRGKILKSQLCEKFGNFEVLTMNLGIFR